MQTYITIHNQFVGYHYWKDAPAATAFLRNPHRHVFHVETVLSVTHDDRDLEFFDMQERINIIIKEQGWDSGQYLTMSCEMFAKRIIEVLTQEDKVKVHSCKVSEDGENSATVVNVAYSTAELEEAMKEVKGLLTSARLVLVALTAEIEATRISVREAFIQENNKPNPNQGTQGN